MSIEVVDPLKALGYVYGNLAPFNSPAVTDDESLIRYHEQHPSSPQSSWRREANIRIFADELVDRFNLVNPHILSAACGSGAEPWEIAVRLSQKEIPFLIDAFDVSPDAISKATKGSVSDISGLDREELIVFEKAGLIKGAGGKSVESHDSFGYLGIEVDPKVMRDVRFFTHDIIDHPFPDSDGGYDAVFCNNLLMHYPAHTRELILVHLLESLKDQGIIALEYNELLGGLAGSAERTAWLGPYYDWKEDLSKFGLEIVPDVFFSQRIYQYNETDNQFRNKKWALRGNEVVEVPQAR